MLRGQIPVYIVILFSFLLLIAITYLIDALTSENIFTNTKKDSLTISKNTIQPPDAIPLDTIPPELVICVPKDRKEYKVIKPEIFVYGRTEPGATIKIEIDEIDDQTSDITPDTKGLFESHLKITKAGKNSITVIARDKAGNETKKVVNATFTPLVPIGYYSSFKPLYSSTYSDLETYVKTLRNFNLLQHGIYPPVKYKENLFDCSQSAAMLEWNLQNAGFDAYMISLQKPFFRYCNY